jgi:predicted acyl esterase
MRRSERGARSRVTGDLVAGPPNLPEETLAKNRCELVDDAFAHPLADAYHAERSPVWENITVPMLSGANWGGQGIHPRGNFAGFVRAASKQKWLEAHGDAHWMSFYSGYGPGRSGSSAISSKAKTPAGSGSHQCSSTFAIPARNSCCDTRRNGPSRAHNGQDSTFTRT